MDIFVHYRFSLQNLKELTEAESLDVVPPSDLEIIYEIKSVKYFLKIFSCDDKNIIILQV